MDGTSGLVLWCGNHLHDPWVPPTARETRESRVSAPVADRAQQHGKVDPGDQAGVPPVHQALATLRAWRQTRRSAPARVVSVASPAKQGARIRQRLFWRFMGRHVQCSYGVATSGKHMQRALARAAHGPGAWAMIRMLVLMGGRFANIMRAAAAAPPGKSPWRPCTPPRSATRAVGGSTQFQPGEKSVSPRQAALCRQNTTAWYARTLAARARANHAAWAVTSAIGPLALHRGARTAWQRRGACGHKGLHLHRRSSARSGRAGGRHRHANAPSVAARQCSSATPARAGSVSVAYDTANVAPSASQAQQRECQRCARQFNSCAPRCRAWGQHDLQGRLGHHHTAPIQRRAASGQGHGQRCAGNNHPSCFMQPLSAAAQGPG